jgi:hypothetical protein
MTEHAAGVVKLSLPPVRKSLLRAETACRVKMVHPGNAGLEGAYTSKTEAVFDVLAARF